MKTKRQATAAMAVLREFISNSQMQCIADACRGEEKQFFFDKLCELADIVNAMPKTYETDSHGDSAIIHLHYFTSGCDWWIREKDKGVPGDASQHQAFGWVSLNGDEPELGYISIVEIRRAGGELDLYWKPKSWSELRNKPTRDTYTGPEVVYIDAANVFDAVPVKKTIPVTFAVLPPWRRALNL